MHDKQCKISYNFRTNTVKYKNLLTSEFFLIVLLVSSSSSFCLQRWLFKIPSCKALALFS